MDFILEANRGQPGVTPNSGHSRNTSSPLRRLTVPAIQAKFPTSLSLALVTDDFLPAATGVGIHVQQVASELARRGHRVVVLTSRHPGQPAVERWKGVRVHRMFSVPTCGLRQALPRTAQLCRILTQNRVEVIHYHYLSFMMLRMMAVARTLGIPAIYTAHMTVDHITSPFFMKPFRPLISWQYRRICREMDDIICVSPNQEREFRTLSPRARVHVVSNPIHFDGTETQETPRPDRFVVLYVGRLSPEKNLGFLMEAFRILLNRCPEAELWIAGKGFHEKALRAKVKKLCLSPQVKFLGQVPHGGLPALYATADVFVLPSLVETQGLVAMEAMRFRRPVIVTNRIVSAHELVENGENGFIVDPDSVDGLAEKLLVLQKNPDLRARMGEAGFRRFPDATIEAIGTRIEDLYREKTRHRRHTHDSGSIPEALSRRAQERSQAVVLWYKTSDGQWLSMTWREYWTRVSQLACVMGNKGLKPDEKVVVILPTCVEWELLDKAALCRGLVVVGLEPQMAWDTMAHVLRDVRPSAVFVADREMARKINTLSEMTFKLSVCMEQCDDPCGPFLDWASLVQQVANESPNPAPALTADAPATYILTSGTTGAAKGIVYTHGQILLAAQSILAAMGPFTSQDTTLAWLPMASPFQRNMNLAALLAGVPLYFLNDPKELMRSLREVNPTLLIGVPRVYEKIYSSVIERFKRIPLKLGMIAIGLLTAAMHIVPRSSKQRDDLSWPRRGYLWLIRKLFKPIRNLLGSRMQMMVSGSAACQEDVLRFFHALGIPLLEAYGVSECSVPISMNRPNDYKIGTVGRPLAENILHFDGEEIEVDGPGVFRGYEGSEKQSNLTSGKYLCTGDLAMVDSEGYLKLVGRKSDQIKTSTGRKIAPWPIEQRLLKATAANEVMVVGQGRPCLTAILCFEGPRTPEQLRVLGNRLKQVNESLGGYERLRGCVVLGRPFSPEREELTRNLKLRREAIQERHRYSIHHLYERIRCGTSDSHRVGNDWVVWL